MNKNGFLSISTLINIILVITAFMIIAGFLTYITLKQSDSQKEQICRNSIKAKMATKLNIEGFSLKLGDLCTTMDKTIDTKNKEEVKKFIADKAARCWWMYGEGEYEDLFGNTNVNIGGKNKCVMCYTIKTKGGFEDISSNEEASFMLNNNYATYGGSYVDYIQRGKGPGNLMILDNIKPREVYAVSFATKNGGCRWCGLASEVSVAAVFTGAVVITAASGGTALLLGGAAAAGGTALEIGSFSAGISSLLQNRDTSTIYISKLKNFNDNQACEKIKKK